MSGVRAGIGRFVSSAVALAVASVTIAGCGHGQQNAPTQVVARVDGHEITVSEVNAVLAQMPAVAPASISALRQQAIHALVEQQLEFDQAKAQKLDQTPAVLLQLELARRQVLANAYLQEVASDVAAPTDDTARRFYDAYPDLFSQRKIFQLRELDAQGGDALEAQVRSDVNAGQNIVAIAAALKAKGLPVQVSDQTLPAERIPLDLLPQLVATAVGQSLVVRDHGVVRVLTVLGAQSQPVDEAHALPVIRQALLNKSRKAAIAQDLQRLTAQAKIQYLGPAARQAATPPPANAAAPAASAPGSAIAQGAAELQ